MPLNEAVRQGCAWIAENAATARPSWFRPTWPTCRRSTGGGARRAGCDWGRHIPDLTGTGTTLLAAPGRPRSTRTTASARQHCTPRLDSCGSMRSTGLPAQTWIDWKISRLIRRPGPVVSRHEQLLADRCPDSAERLSRRRGHFSPDLGRDDFVAQVPAWVPFSADFVVVSSGIVEIVLGLALLFVVRQRALVGLVVAAFFVASSPATSRSTSRARTHSVWTLTRSASFGCSSNLCSSCGRCWCTGALALPSRAPHGK